MGQFDQFANQGGPAAESADALAEARRVTDEQLKNADYAGDLPEPLGGRHVSTELSEQNRAAENAAAEAAGDEASHD